MTAAMLGLGKIMRRPAIGALLPTFSGRPTLLLDAGASVDVRPEDLAEYAVVGSLYVENVLGVERPRVGLVNIGVEEEKGNEQVRTAYALLRELDINFVGNVEGRDVTAGEVDVLVCDGFVGNVVLKVVEGLGLGIFSMIREEIGQSFQSRLGGLLVRTRLRTLGRRLDYFNYGGAPMLGLEGSPDQ
ncbi:glycerol-3-phosphate acyltransferase PlsX, partial [mine drainage metagenome]